MSRRVHSSFGVKATEMGKDEKRGSCDPPSWDNPFGKINGERACDSSFAAPVADQP